MRCTRLPDGPAGKPFTTGWPGRSVRRHVRLVAATIDAVVPRAHALELDDGAVLFGRPAWPTWVADPDGSPPMWVADEVNDDAVARLVMLFPSTGLWPLRLLAGDRERWGLIPVRRPADVPSRLCPGARGSGRHPGVTLSSFLASWEDQCGAVLVGLGPDRAIVDPRRGDGSTWVLSWSPDGRLTAGSSTDRSDTTLDTFGALDVLDTLDDHDSSFDVATSTTDAPAED